MAVNGALFVVLVAVGGAVWLNRTPAQVRVRVFSLRRLTVFSSIPLGTMLVVSLILTVVAGGEVAGYVLSFERDGRREVGYWIGRDHWGRGVATAALVAFLGEEKARPLHAGVLPANGASLRVLEKCGFAVVGEDEDEGVVLILLRLG